MTYSDTNDFSAYNPNELAIQSKNVDSYHTHHTKGCQDKWVDNAKCTMRKGTTILPILEAINFITVIFQEVGLISGSREMSSKSLYPITPPEIKAPTMIKMTIVKTLIILNQYSASPYPRAPKRLRMKMMTSHIRDPISTAQSVSECLHCEIYTTYMLHPVQHRSKIAWQVVKPLIQLRQQ